MELYKVWEHVEELLEISSQEFNQLRKKLKNIIVSMFPKNVLIQRYL